MPPDLLTLTPPLPPLGLQGTFGGNCVLKASTMRTVRSHQIITSFLKSRAEAFVGTQVRFYVQSHTNICLGAALENIKRFCMMMALGAAQEQQLRQVRTPVKGL